MAAGYSFSCALHAGGTVKCWGDNKYGQLGNGTAAASSTPVSVIGITGATALTAGFGHACALIADGTVQCWGSNSSGELGDGTLSQNTEVGSTLAVSVSDLSDAVAVAAGTDFTCALRSAGTVVCWGDDFYGELGNTMVMVSPTPVAVAGLDHAIAIAAGYDSACAALASGGAICWGDNSEGQLGTPACPNPTPGATYWCPTPPVMVPGLGGVAGLATANFGTCSWQSGGAADCWGLDIGGYLGNGQGALATTWGPYPPGSLSNVSGVTAVTMGQFHGCALTASGTALCWGQNHAGQIGNGGGSDVYTPAAVGSLFDVTAIAAGGDHTCAIAAGTTLYCWGANSWGELGQASAGTCDDGVAGTVPCTTTPAIVPWQ